MDYTSTYTDTSALTTGVVGILAVFFIVLFLFIIVFAVFSIIGTWKVLKKAGQPGWAAIVPYYANYCQCKVNGLTPWWVLVVAIASIIYSTASKNDSYGIFSLLASLISIYFSVVSSISLARSFGKSDAYAVGLVLLNPFFMFALGIGKSQYIGPRPCDPIGNMIMKNINSNNNNNNNNYNNTNNMNNNQNMNNVQPMNNNMVNNVNAQTGMTCPNCGANIASGQQFCQNCGKQIQ